MKKSALAWTLLLRAPERIFKIIQIIIYIKIRNNKSNTYVVVFFFLEIITTHLRKDYPLIII